MSTSTISNTITDPIGTALSGVRIVAKLMPCGGFRTIAGTEVARTVETTTNASGVWTLVLEENAGITPSSTYYRITEYIPSDPQTWNITVGASDQTVLAAQTNPLPTTSTSNYLTQASADARYQALGSLGSGTPGTETPDHAGTAGVSSSASRADHIHPIDAAAASGLTNTSTSTEGAATSFARSDHTHAITWNPPACRANRTTDQTISNNTVTAVQLNAADSYDTGTTHDTVTNNTRITVPTAGLYQCTFNWTMNTSGSAMIGDLRVNGTTSWSSVRQDTSGTVSQLISDVIKLAANDYIEGTVFQFTGGNVTLSRAALSVVWVGTGN